MKMQDNHISRIKLPILKIMVIMINYDNTDDDYDSEDCTGYHLTRVQRL